MSQIDFDKYLSGEKLYGNDFTPEQIETWYQEESEGYANLGNTDSSDYFYGYHEMNKLHGFSKIENRKYTNALGIGSAWGHEFMPVIENIEQLTLLEPSTQMQTVKIGNLIPTYVKPRPDGIINFNDNTFDLITCFGVLHHIPNVSFVLNELIRVLMPGGFMMIREPFVSMGDWRKPRNGLTKNERGIPLSIFETAFNNHRIKVLSKNYCFTNTSVIQRLTGKFLKKPIYSFKPYVVFDKSISKILKRNVRYHPTNPIHKIGPSNVFYVVQKIN